MTSGSRPKIVIVVYLSIIVFLSGFKGRGLPRHEGLGVRAAAFSVVPVQAPGVAARGRGRSE